MAGAGRRAALRALLGRGDLNVGWSLVMARLLPRRGRGERLPRARARDPQAAPAAGLAAAPRRSRPTEHEIDARGRARARDGRVPGARSEVLTPRQQRGTIRDGPPARPHHAGRRRHAHRRLEALVGPADGPAALYELWERRHWAAHAIDFERDKADWAGLNDDDRREIAWSLSSFFVGEERVTTQFSGLVMAYDTQIGGGVPHHAAGRRGSPRPALRPLLDEVLGLDDTFERPARARARGISPTTSSSCSTATSSTPATRWSPTRATAGAKVDFVTTYHMVIEGTLALTGQHFITDASRSAASCPASPRASADRRRRAPPRRLRHVVPAARGGRSRRCAGASPTG